jgi:hypothetical protein
MKRFSRTGTVFSIVAASVCISAVAFSATEKKSTMPAPDTKTKSAVSSEPSSLSGKVVETMNSGGYTYVCLEKNGKKTWVAVPQMKVTVGEQAAFLPGTEMGNFKSKSLDRTFDSIIFSGGPAVAQGSSSMPAGHGDAGKKAAGSKSAASPTEKNIKVEKAAGADAYTVGEIFEKRAALDKKTVTLQGKVVKVSSGIMGKNWIHVQDGTGDAKKSTHNLVVTSDDKPEVGDVVIVKGTVFKDKDFGSGYKYSVIIEKASISKQ